MGIRDIFTKLMNGSDFINSSTADENRNGYNGSASGANSSNSFANRNESLSIVPFKIDKTNYNRVLETDLKSINIRGIHYLNDKYSDKDIDATLFGLPFERAAFVNPSYAAAITLNLYLNNEKRPLNIYLDFLSMSVPELNRKRTEYSENGFLKLCKKESDNGRGSEEITFLSSIDVGESRSLTGYTASLPEENKSYVLYPYDNIFGNRPASYKGAVVQDLKLQDAENDLRQIDASAGNILFGEEADENAFETFSYDLYKKFGGRLGYIGVINGVLIIKGTDEDEKTIYTSLPERELTDRLKKLQNTRLVNSIPTEETQNSNLQKEIVSENKVIDIE